MERIAFQLGNFWKLINAIHHFLPDKKLKNVYLGAGEMAQKLTALAALPNNPGLLPSSDMKAPNFLPLSSRRPIFLFWPPWAPPVVCKQDPQTHKNATSQGCGGE